MCPWALFVMCFFTPVEGVKYFVFSATNRISSRGHSRDRSVVLMELVAMCVGSSEPGMKRAASDFLEAARLQH
jgi:hypothetical protein